MSRYFSSHSFQARPAPLGWNVPMNPTAASDPYTPLTRILVRYALVMLSLIHI